MVGALAALDSGCIYRVTETWAHRGASAYAPENTLPAFEEVVRLGLAGVEFDVQRSADGAIVCIHDETVNRTSNGFGRVVDLPLEELRRCDFSNGFSGRHGVKIPTLREALEVFQGTNVTVNIELKNGIELYPGMEDQVVRIIRDAGLLDQVVISSLNHYSIANLRGHLAASQMALILTDGIVDPWRYASWFGAGAVHPHRLALRIPDYVWLAHEAGIKVRAWTIDDDAEAIHLAGLGVDAIISNIPDRVRDALRHPVY